jgi:hypothetical protein
MPIALIKKNKFSGLSPQANYTDCRLSAKLVPPFAGRWIGVVSSTDSHGRYSRFSRTGAATIPLKWLLLSSQGRVDFVSDNSFTENLITPGGLTTRPPRRSSDNINNESKIIAIIKRVMVTKKCRS